MNIRNIIYARVSTREQVNGDSIESQIEIIKKSHPKLKFEIITDLGYSGKNTNRKGYKQLKNILDNNNNIHVYGRALDRFNRNLTENIKFLKLFNSGNKLFTILNGEINNTNADDIFVNMINAAQAERESNIISNRVKMTQHYLLQQGKYPYGSAKKFLGIDISKDKIITFNDDIFIVKEIFSLFYEEGFNKAQIKRLMETKYPHISWYKEKINSILKKTIYQGFIIKDDIKYEVCDKVIDLDLYDLSNPKIKKPKKNKYNYLFENKVFYNNLVLDVTCSIKNKVKVYKYYGSRKIGVYLSETKLFDSIEFAISNINNTTSKKIKEKYKRKFIDNVDNLCEDELFNMIKKYKEISNNNILGINIDEITRIDVTIENDKTFIEFIYKNKKFKQEYNKFK